jgi:hypothetical protein
MKLSPSFKILLILGIFLALIGCTSIDDRMKSYLGANKNELLSNWGVPQNIMPDGNGGEIWSYIKSGQTTTHGMGTTNTYGSAQAIGSNAYYQGTSYSTSTPSYTTTWTRTCSFFIDSTGTIYKYAWNRN